MKKHYLNPSLKVVEIQQRCNILGGSNVSGVSGNTGIGYGGGGNVDPMSRKFGGEWGEDEEW